MKYVDFFEPKVFVMENVAGMKSYLSSGNAPIIDIINQEFESLGYKVNVKILNSANYGVPQSRERISVFWN